MSTYSSQDEIEQLKAWWKNYGTSLIVGVVLGLAMLFGYRYWTSYREAQRVAASAIYDQLVEDIQARKSDARVPGEKLIAEFSSTPYAGMAALLLARQAYEAGDKTLARQRLEWALANAKDAATGHAARLRLAHLLLEAGDIAAAKPLIDIKDVAGFEAEYDELRGDLALAQHQPDAARQAYQSALQHLTSGSAYRAVLAMKLDDLGGEKKP